ncbi:MAG: hypothetical protein ACOH2I_02815 [Pseudomonas sp.]
MLPCCWKTSASRWSRRSIPSIYAGCEPPTRCQVARHVALDELREDVWPTTDGLLDGYRQQLGAAGLSLSAGG